MAKHIFTSLRDVLISGGEIAVGLFISAGHSLKDAAVFAAHRFEGIDPTSLSTLVNIGAQGSQAAMALNRLNPSDELPLDIIPIQPLMYGDDPQGKRIKLVGGLVGTEGTPLVDFRQDFAVADTIQTMLDYVRQLYEAYRDDPRYERLAEQLLNEELTLIEFNFTFAQRRY